VVPKIARGYELDHLLRPQCGEVVVAHMQHLAQHLVGVLAGGGR
jgi:hypothetical protein